jgi:hypothetical protein
MAKQTLDSHKDYVKWEKVGQTLTGILIRMEVSKHPKYKGELLVLETEDGKVFCAAPLNLAETVRDNFDKLVGELITIRYTSDQETKGGNSMKMFEVDYDDGN